MALVFDILEEEKNRLLSLKRRYENQLKELPKGSLSWKKRWHRVYLYLVYRVSGKVRFQYIGPADSDEAKTIESQIRKRRDLEDKLGQVENNLVEVERGLRGKR